MKSFPQGKVDKIVYNYSRAVDNMPEAFIFACFWLVDIDAEKTGKRLT